MRCVQECEDEEIGPEQGLFLLRGDAQDLPFRKQQIDYAPRGSRLLSGWLRSGGPSAGERWNDQKRC